MPGQVFNEAYRDITRSVTQTFWNEVKAFLIFSFRLSADSVFRNADYTFNLIGFEPGSVIVKYDLGIAVNDTSTTELTVPAIKSAMESGLNASNGSSAFSMDPNSTVSAFDYCANKTLCSQYATCTNLASTSTYDCTCNSGYTDEDTSVKGTKCTQQCDTSSTKVYCSGNGICRTNKYGNTSCQCFDGYEGEACTNVRLSGAILAVVIVVPILFVIIVVVIAVIVYICRRQRRFKRAMFDTMSHQHDPNNYDENDQFRPIPQSSAGSLKNSVRIPRARLAEPRDFERAESHLSSEAPYNFEQPAPSFSYPFKRYSDTTFRSGGEAGPSKEEDDGRQYF